MRAVLCMYPWTSKCQEEISFTEPETGCWQHQTSTETFLLNQISLSWSKFQCIRAPEQRLFARKSFAISNCLFADLHSFNRIWKVRSKTAAGYEASTLVPSCVDWKLCWYVCLHWFYAMHFRVMKQIFQVSLSLCLDELLNFTSSFDLNLRNRSICL